MEQLEEHKVSCIVPCYNAEETLPALLESIASSKYQNYEVILVNDGSTDGTWNVIQEWAAKDKRIVPVNKENGGVGSARNAGLDAATGDYICFFDADDTIHSRTIDRHVRRMVKDDMVMSIGEVMSVNMNEEHVMKSTVRLGENTNIRKYTKSINWSFSVWNKCFRRDLIEKNHIRFNDTKHAEDAVFVFQYIHSTDGVISGIPAVVYRYVKKPFWEGISLSRSVDIGAINSIKSNMNEIIDLVDKSIAKDKAELEQTTELTPDEVKTKYENMAGYRSNLFRRFIHSTLLNEYYRFIWNTEDGVFDILKELYENYLSNLSDKDREAVYSQHEDLRLRNGMMNKEELAADPLITVAISDEVPAEKVASLVNGYYNQSFPAFELLVGSIAACSIPDEVRSRLNLHVMDACDTSSFKKMALSKAKGRYVIFTDEYLVPSTSTLSEIYSLFNVSDADFVTTDILALRNGKIKGLKAYKVYTGKEEIDGLSAKDIVAIDSTFWGNKVFRTDSLKKSATFSSRSGKGDCLRKMFKEMKSVIYKDNAFISDFTDDELVGRLGILEKMSIGKKLK